MLRASVLAVSLVAITAGRALAQEQTAMPPLAAVARQAEAAKATVKKAKKSYTNADLGKDPHGEPAPAPPSSGLVSKSLGKPVAAEAQVARSEAKVGADTSAQESEDAWRNRAAAVRKQVDQLRERLTELTTSDASRAESPAVRAINASDVANTRTAIESVRKQWSRLEASARERKIPQSWIEPQPTFPQQ